MGHVKLINNTGQTIRVKLEREEAKQEVLTYECEDLERCELPMEFDWKSGKVTEAVITIKAKKEALD